MKCVEALFKLPGIKSLWSIECTKKVYTNSDKHQLNKNKFTID